MLSGVVQLGSLWKRTGAAAKILIGNRATPLFDGLTLAWCRDRGPERCLELGLELGHSLCFSSFRDGGRAHSNIGLYPR